MAEMLIHEKIYRGEGILDKIAKAPVFVCGAGAIGSNLVDNMARQGFQKISVLDFDRVDIHNVHTQTYGRRDAGQLKVAALRTDVFNATAVDVQVQSRKLDSGNIRKLLKSGDIVVDGFDNVESRAVVANYCAAYRIRCLHVGLYKDYAEVIWNDRYRIPDDTKGMDVCEYPLARNIIMLAVAVATEVIVRYVSSRKQESYVITLGDFKIVSV